jgi:hypothetical protein
MNYLHSGRHRVRYERNKLRVVALVHRHLIPPEKVEEAPTSTSAPWRTEYDVISTLSAMGHEVNTLPVHDDLGEIRRLVHRVEAAHRVQPAGGLRRHHDLRSERASRHLELLETAGTPAAIRAAADGA